MKLLTKTAIGGLLSLLCIHADAADGFFSFLSNKDGDQKETVAQPASAVLTNKAISIPVYNLISDTLVSMVPTVGGQRNDTVMQLICDMARGVKDQKTVTETLLRSGVNVDAIPKKGDPLSLLVNGDIKTQKSACAAYIASSLLVATEHNDWFVQQKTAEKAAALKSKNDKSTAPEPKVTVRTVFNADGFSQDMRVKSSVARATAQLYAVVAANLTNAPDKSWGEYQMRISEIVALYADDYLSLVKNTFAVNSAQFTPVNINKIQYDVIDNAGNRFVYGDDLFVWRNKGVVWLGAGKIMGKDFYVDVKVIK